MNKDPSFSFNCNHCHQTCQMTGDLKPRFCPFCGTLQAQTEQSEQVVLPYQIQKSIGKGGMGEVFLAYDLSCGRRIALKQIRSDLIEHPQIRRRFLTEAHITCQLTHPAIIPIYDIEANQSTAYYTMPFVEGETLKQIIRKTRQQEKKGEKLDHIGGSIPALMRIFVTICQAVAYAHSRGVIHRDLKPENIIIGKYGEVLILDWGLAKLHDSPLEEEETTVALHHLPPDDKKYMTRVGKVVGTIAYMAPERALGQPATIQTDIYSLGVILYQLLTLQPPFKRESLEEFRKNMDLEEWVDPVQAAPYRDVPHMLARFTEKCVAKDLNERYHTVDELIRDVENYIEGRSEWFEVAQLDVKKKEDWEFQENILIAEHVAVTRVTEEAEWVSLMISRQSFFGNTKIETEVYLGEKSNGIGILLSIPEVTERSDINEGYCLWLSVDNNRTTRLLRSGVEVVHAPDIFLKRNQWVKVRIEKIEKSIHLYLNDILQFSYIAHIPLIGTHVGLLSRDDDYQISFLNIYVGSLNIMVDCLAVPDAFFAQHDYQQALSEYRRIAYSFPDRAEGREAIFRAGLTFIEQAKTSDTKDKLLDEALEEFEKLHGTPGAPLEYLGKALVYETLKDDEEEIKCFDLAYRRYPRHPLLPVLQEQIISRMHEVSRKQRSTTYRFILLSIRHLDISSMDTHTRRLFNSLQKYWEILPFIEENPSKSFTLHYLRFAIPLAFWLAKPYVLGEILDDLLASNHTCSLEIENAFFSLLELGAVEYAESKLIEAKAQLSSKQNPELKSAPTTALSEDPTTGCEANHVGIDWSSLESAIASRKEPLEDVYKTYFQKPFSSITYKQLRPLLFFMDQAIDQSKTALVHAVSHPLKNLSFDFQLQVHIRQIWAYLIESDWLKAGEIFYSYPVDLLNKDSTYLHFLYGCWLQATEGKEMSTIHFTGLLSTTYPRTWNLAGHYILNALPKTWFDKAFLWEKKALYRQLALYYHCAGRSEQKSHYLKLYFEDDSFLAK